MTTDQTDGLSRRTFLGAGGAIALGGSASAQGSTELDRLVAAAHNEGEVLFYCAQVDAVGKRVSDAFTKKYGVKCQHLRLSSSPLQQRFAAEAEAGKIAADLLLNGGNTAGFSAEGLKNGWIEPIRKAGIPAVSSTEFPAKYISDGAAMVMITPWLIMYNTDKVKQSAAPKDWKELLDPRFKGQIIINEPNVAPGYFDFWCAIIDNLGPDYMTALRAQNLRVFNDGVAASQSLAAGEGSFFIPTVASVVGQLAIKGAPVDMVTPALTTGSEFSVLLPTLSKIKHPNAGRLLAHYLMTEEGNKVLNADPGAISVFDPSGLPAQYKSPAPNTIARRDEVRAALGLK